MDSATYGQMLFNLFGVLLLLISMLYVLKKLRYKRYASDKAIKILHVLSLGNKEKLAVVQVHDTALVLGITAHTINTLHQFPYQQPLAPADATQPAAAGFAQQLKQLLKSDKIEA